MIGWIGVLSLSVVGYYVYDTLRKWRYWKSKGIPSLFPYPIVGQLPQVLKAGVSGFDQKWIGRVGRKFGFWEGSHPVIEIADPDILRIIMVKDFAHFVDKRSLEGIQGKILDQNVSALKGQHWKDVRSILVPTFTSGKLRHMNPLIMDCCDSMMHRMEKLAEDGEEFEAKEFYGRVTVDVIASAFFATKIDSQTNPQNEFVMQANKAFLTLANPLVLISLVLPKLVPLALKLGLEGIPHKTVDFFVQNTKEILRLRKENPQNNRRDFIQIMLKSLREDGDAAMPTTERHGKEAVRSDTHVRDISGGDAEDVDRTVDIVSQDITSTNDNFLAHSGYKLTTEVSPTILEKPLERLCGYMKKLSFESAPNLKMPYFAVFHRSESKELVAQAVTFFLAGYETTATTLSFLSYNLATNLKIQDKLREEIECVMAGNKAPTYELVSQMEYLDMCVNETLRLFPPAARNERLCTEDWHHDGLHLEKGTVVLIPVYALQRDPEYWQEPDTFNPERFSKENKQTITPYTFQAFGQGPRNCIGMRFAMYEIKMVMVSILRKFRFVPSAKTEIPLQIVTVGLLNAKNGVHIKVEKL